jgi:predicted Zn-dependent peptidase
MTYQLTTLSSGLRVASEALPGVESVAVAVSVGVGSRYESEAEGGISHLLEHMAFKGTTSRTALSIAEAFDNIGGQFNAYTSSENTVYYAKVLKDALPLAVDILADIMLRSLFDAEELRKEQGVVLQEIAAHFDTPDDLIFDLFDAVAFPDQPLGRSILGRPEQVEAYKREALMRYMATHYSPSRMVLSAAGNVSHAQLVTLADQFFAALTGPAAPAPQPGRYKGGDTRTARKLEQLHLMMGFPGVSVHHQDYYTMQLYANILGGGMSSRLFQEIREKRGLAYHVSSSASTYADCGTLVIYSATSMEHGAQLPLLVADELKRMAEGVSAAELSRAKNQQKAELLMARENPGTVASWIGKHLLLFNRYRELPEIVANIDAVTEADIRRVGAEIVASPLTLAALGPVKAIPPHEKITARLLS